MLVLAGPSAVGKTTVSREIIGQSDKFEFIRSATTRAPRGDAFDSEYIYLTDEEFRRELEGGGMLEHTEYSGSLYGTPRSEILRAEREGKIPLLILDVFGVESIRRGRYSDDMFAVYLYDELNVLEERLYQRYMTPPTVTGLTRFVKRREQNIKDYLYFEDRACLFDLLIFNDSAEKSAASIISAMKSESISRDNSDVVSKLYNMANSKLTKK